MPPAEAFRAPTATPAPEVSRPRLAVPDSLRIEHLRRVRWLDAAFVSLLVLVSLGLRVRSLDFHYWVDEGIAVGIASHPLSHIPGLLRQDGSPPLYYLLLHVWMAWRGKTEVATHELSLIFALLTIPVAYWAAKSMFGRRAGLMAAVLAALAPYLTVYAQETRMYSMVALLSLFVAGSFAQAFVFGRRRYVPVFGVSLALSLYSHNWALFLGLACAIAFLVCLYEFPDRRRALWRDGLLGFGLAVLLFLPWLPTLIYQAQHTGAPWDLPPILWSITESLYVLVGGRGAAVALLFGGGAGLLAVWRYSGERERRVFQAGVALAVIGLGTLLIAWAYSKISPAWAFRYLAVIVGPMLLLFALGLARGGRMAVFAIVLCSCFWILDPPPSSVNYKSNVAAAVGRVRAHIPASAIVVSTQPEQVPTISYYLPHVKHFVTPIGPVPDAHVVDWRSALSKLEKASVSRTLMPLVRSLPPGRRLVIVVPTNLPDAPLYLKLIGRMSKTWPAALESDRQLKYIASSELHSASAGVPVRVTVFERR